MKKIMTAMLILSLVFGLFGCGTGNAPEPVPAETQQEGAAEDSVTAADTMHTIGVLTYSRTEEEALAFRDYLDNYIASCFNVTFLYSDEVSDAQGVLDYINLAAENGVEGIMSFNSYDLAAEVALCEQNEIYYMMASSSIDDKEFDAVADNPWFLGVVGPGSEVEYQAGVDLAQNFIDKQYTDEYFVIAGLGLWGNEMHTERTKGVLDALQAAYDVTFDVASEEVAVSDQITHLEAGNLKVCVVPGYMQIDSFLEPAIHEYEEHAYNVVLSVLAGSAMRDVLMDAGAHVGIIDSFTESNKLAMETGELEYVAGKYRSMIGPSFAAMYNAVTGYADQFREADGKAFHVAQGFWTSGDSEDFAKKYTLGSSLELNAYNFEDLYNVCAVYNGNASLDELKALAAAYSYEEVAARRGIE